MFVPDSDSEKRCFECFPRSAVLPPKLEGDTSSRSSKKRSRGGVSEYAKGEAIGQIKQGLGLIFVGGLVTGGTYMFATVTGGFYLLAYGPLLIGVLRLIFGIHQYFGG